MPYYPPSQKNSAETTWFLAGGDIAAQTVQAAIAELDAEKAKAGVNTDITSLGSLTQPLVINGNIEIPNISKFAAYNSVDQNASTPKLAYAETFNKVDLDSKLFDTLNEFNNSSFIAQNSGVYIFNASVGLIRREPGGVWRLIVTLFKNGTEIVRGNDLTMDLPYGGSSVTGLCNLEAGDRIELFLYTNLNCYFYAGSAVTALRGIKIA